MQLRHEKEGSQGHILDPGFYPNSDVINSSILRILLLTLRFKDLTYVYLT